MAQATNHEKLRVLKLLESERGKALLTQHKLRRTASPLRSWRESRGTSVNLYKKGIRGILKPLGTVHISKHGNLVVDYNHPIRTSEYQKLFYFARDLANRNSLIIVHNPKKR